MRLSFFVFMHIVVFFFVFAIVIWLFCVELLHTIN